MTWETIYTYKELICNDRIASLILEYDGEYYSWDIGSNSNYVLMDETEFDGFLSDLLKIRKERKGKRYEVQMEHTRKGFEGSNGEGSSEEESGSSEREEVG